MMKKKKSTYSCNDVFREESPRELSHERREIKDTVDSSVEQLLNRKKSIMNKHFFSFFFFLFLMHGD